MKTTKEIKEMLKNARSELEGMNPIPLDKRGEKFEEILQYGVSKGIIFALEFVLREKGK